MRHKLLFGAVIATSFFSWAASDPVLMRINDKDVKLSEFEYLYNKNKQQQLEKESLEQYVDRFVTYKLKVAAAEDAGIDTTRAFIKEFSTYRDELAKPYLDDGSTNKRLAQEAYKRMETERDVCHIMLPLNEKSQLDNKAKLDSIRKCVLNGESFEDLALKYSSDPSVKRNKGDLGFLMQGRLPYVFEEMAYATPVGSISNVFATDFGYHIIKVKSERANRGKVNVEHIMKLYPQNATDSIKGVLKSQMDSIYNLVTAGANFEDLAKKLSDDKGSAQNGGALPWFGTGEMVPTFENVAFSINDGEISKPFESPYGIHIIKKLGHKPMDSYQEVEKKLLSAINSDSRSKMALKEKAAQLKKVYKLKENKKLASYFNNEIMQAGEYDSAFVAKMRNSSEIAYSFANKKFTVSSFSKNLNPKKKIRTNEVADYLLGVVNDAENEEILSYEKDNLVNKHTEYKNLLNEYRDGMLLFEISNRNVWDKAARDADGLNEYFAAHKSNYTWETPKFKGLLLHATSDSIAKLAKEAAKNIGNDTLASTLRKMFKRDIRIEKLLIGKGENPKIDELIFNGAKAPVTDKHYSHYFILDGKVIDQPEDAADVRGQVTSDYQNVLEDKWNKELRNKYKVVINKKVMDAVK